MTGRALAIGMVLGGAALLADGGGAAAPLPLPRPKPVETSAGPPEAPLPVPRPKPGPEAPPAAQPPAAQPPAAQPPIVAAPRPAPDPAETAACLQRLQTLGLRFTALPPIADPAGCTVAAPIRLTGLTPSLAVEPAATVTCPLAEALAAWARETVAVEASAILQAEPRVLRIATSFQCRPRNHVAGAKLSEHGHANAVDIAGIGFARGPDYVPAAIRPGDETPASRFAAALKAGACARFTTVLAPGSDAAHPDHFHLDLAPRRNGYRICQ